MAELALHADCATVLLHERLRDGEAQTCAALAASGRAVELLKPREHALLILESDPGATVSHFESYAATARQAGGQIDALTFFGKRNCVRNEIREHLNQSIRVAITHQQGAVVVNHQLDALLGRRWTQGISHLMRQAMGGDSLTFQCDPARFDILQIQNIRDQSYETLGVAVSDLDELSTFARQLPRGTPGHQGQRPPDCSERSPKLVGYGRHELVFHPRDFPLMRDVAIAGDEASSSARIADPRSFELHRLAGVKVELSRFLRFRQPIGTRVSFSMNDGGSNMAAAELFEW